MNSNLISLTPFTKQVRTTYINHARWHWSFHLCERKHSCPNF